MNGFAANGMHSHRDLGQCVASKSITRLMRKSATASVPFMDGCYDFSAIDGDVYYEMRTLTYSFDFLGGTPADVERQVSEFEEWLAGIRSAAIYDDDIPGYHYIGSFVEASAEYDESGLAATLTAKLSVEPFREADEESCARLAAGSNVIVNRGRKAQVTATSEGTTTLVNGSLRQSFSGEVRLDIALQHGENEMELEGDPCVLKWRERRV